MKKVTLCVVAFYVFLWVSLEYRAQTGPAAPARPAFKKIPKTDKPVKYLEFHRGIRTREDDAAPGYEQNYKWKELRRAKQHAAARKRSGAGRGKNNGVVNWVERGPGNVPGRTRAILNVPGDPANNTWLAGSATGGIWRTANGGASWSERSKDFPALPISSFASSQNGSIIYAATGEFVSSVFSSIGNGIFKSVDKGLTWQQLPSTNNNPEFSVVTRLITNPADGRIIVATTVPHNLSTDKTSSVMRSADGGETWAKVKEITGILEQVIAAPDNFNNQYISQHGMGIWKSTDAGLTWSLSSDGMAAFGRLEIAISPVNPNKIFVAAEGNLSGTTADLYHSPDAGITWSLIDMQFNGKPIDFLDGQGFYDNVILCDPFHAGKFYVGGVSLFRTTLGSASTVVDNWQIRENGTSEIIFLQSFRNIEWDHERLTVDESDPRITVELRFGSGQSQKAHRFFVPPGATDGVDASDYTYQDYASVPFEAWDITNPSAPRQLMVSFRDQNRNGFDLVPQNLEATDPPAEHSREYVYIHTVAYHATLPSSQITINGGHLKNLAYNIFPCLAPGASWPATFPDATMEIRYTGISKYTATTITAADGRSTYDKKNKADQINLDKGVHPDHHCMVPVITDPAAKTYKIILGNDGGVFVSKASSDPGTTEGDWQFRGIGYNTSQFYGADKRPGKDQYIGGMQDNGTRFSPADESADAASAYHFAVGGDGFEALWNNKDETRILGSVYYGQVYRSIDGGSTWETAMVGLNAGTQDFPFVTKLANSKEFPDRVFTVGAKGVYVSQNFGSRWNLTAIPDRFVTGSGFYLDVEVSRADANIVWAGSGMSDSGASARNIHVSKDGGATFSPTQNYTTAELGNITKLATHPTEPHTAYALFSFAGSPKILRTKDLGQSWEDISGFGNGSPGTTGFPDVAVYCLYVRPDNPDILWAGTEIGIVESLDNGENWALLEDFPNVAVWDMKGQDHQVVIATHGRGIWTAGLEADQVTGKTPSVIASGTAPGGDLVLRISTLESYDSVQVRVESRVSKTFYSITPGTHDLALANVAAGEKNIRIISYKANVPYQSGNHRMQHHFILAPKNSYSTYFNTLTDLHIDGLILQDFSAGVNQRRSLHTGHNYSPDQTYELLIRTPVKVSSTMPVLFYRDIGIIEPENDSIIVEATRNGLDWSALSPPYDANFEGDKNSAWKNAYLNQRPGNASMFLNHEINFGDKFAAEELILFRFRVISGPAVTSWGWALDYVSIQEPPLTPVIPEIKESSVSIFPNPSQGNVTMEYILKNPSDITIHVADIYGKTSGRLLTASRKAGYHSENLDLSGMAQGTYLIILHSAEGRMAGKITLLR